MEQTDQKPCKMLDCRKWMKPLRTIVIHPVIVLPMYLGNIFSFWSFETPQRLLEVTKLHFKKTQM